MARYYQTQLVKPISQYAPAPLKYIDEAGAAMQDQTNKGMLAVDALQEALNIKGGYKTQQRAKDLVAEYKPQLEKVAAELNSTGQISGGIGKVSSLINGLKANSEYQDIMADQAKTASGEVDKTITQPGFSTYVQDIIDPNTKQFKQTKKGERFDDRWYQAVQPGNTNKEFKPLYDQVKPVIDKIYNTPVTQSWTDETGAVHTQTLQEGIETESLRKDQVRKALSDYFDNDPNALNQQSLIYNKALNEKQGKEYTNENALEDVTNAFLGAYSTEKEIQKLGADRVTKLGKGASSGSGSGTKAPDNVAVKYDNLLESLDNSSDKAAKSNTGDLVALHGGNDNKDGTFTTNTTGKPVYIQIGKTAYSGESVEKSIKLNKFINLKAEEENIKGSGDDLGGTLISGMEKRDPKYDYFFEGGGEDAIIYKMNKDGTNKTKVGIVKEVYEKEKNSGLFPKYTELVKKAAKEDINLDDKDLNIQSKAFNGDKTIEEFSILMSNLSGDRKFSQGSGKNTFLDSDGNLITKQTMTLTEADLDSMLSSSEGLDLWGLRNTGWKKLAANHPDLLKKGQTDKDGNQLYNIDTFIKVDNDASIASEQMQKNAYSTQDGGMPEWLQNALPNTNQGSVDKTTILKTKYADKKYAEKFENAYLDKDKTKIVTLKDDWNKFFSSVVNSEEGKKVFNGQDGNLSTDALTEAHAKIIELPEDTKQQRKDKAKLMNDYKLFLTQPDVYNMLNPSNDTTSSNTSSEGSDLATKNNNPGNIRDNNGSFKKFDNIQEGYTAMVGDLSSKLNGKSSAMISQYGANYLEDGTLQDLLHVYAPSTDSNNPIQYAQTVAKILGIGRNTSLKNIDPAKLAEAMMQVESPEAYKKFKNQS